MNFPLGLFNLDSEQEREDARGVPNSEPGLRFRMEMQDRGVFVRSLRPNGPWLTERADPHIIERVEEFPVKSYQRFPCPSRSLLEVCTQHTHPRSVNADRSSRWVKCMFCYLNTLIQVAFCPNLLHLACVPINAEVHTTLDTVSWRATTVASGSQSHHPV